jgi:hypothetical protein
MGEGKIVYRVGKPKRKRPLKRRGRRWEDIRMDLRKIGW